MSYWIQGHDLKAVRCCRCRWWFVPIDGLLLDRKVKNGYQCWPCWYNNNEGRHDGEPTHRGQEPAGPNAHS